MLYVFLKIKHASDYTSIPGHNAKMAMVTKASFQTKYLGNGDYFVIIASSFHPLLWTEHATNGLIEVPSK